MMECKKALVETKGDLDAAAELMRKQGLAKADKKAARVAAEGVVVIEKSTDAHAAAMVEINCETDFVAREQDFRAFAQAVAARALASRPASLEALLEAKLESGESIEERRRALVAAKGGDAQLAHDLAMHVAASNPKYLTQAQVPADVVAKEREILTEQAQSEGKPPEIVTKMVEGRLRKSLSEITLTGQPFVKDPDVTIEKLLKGAKAEVAAFERFEVGAGIEKKQDDFVAEVMAQVSGANKGASPAGNQGAGPRVKH
jgi:elongation factor Ts